MAHPRGRNKRTYWAAPLAFWLAAAAGVVAAPAAQGPQVLGETVPPGRFFIVRADPDPAANQIVIEWRSRADPRRQLSAITWYYTEDPANRASYRRLRTHFQDDFSQQFLGWNAGQGLGGDWFVGSDPRAQLDRIARSRPGAGPLVSLQGWPGDIVVSALLRPSVGNNSFGIAARVSPQADAFVALRGNAQLVSQQREQPFDERVVPQINALNWHWYELGVMEERRGSILLRARIYNQERRVLATLWNRVRAGEPGLPSGGLIALLGQADFAEVHVDPWSARWEDDRENRLVWNTADVPPGSYHIVAEITEDRTPRYAVSRFRVTR